MIVIVIDYGLGNLGSIVNMLRKVGAEVVISSDIATIKQADKLILPGVGAFDSGMRNLQDRGLIPVLNRKVLRDKTPILGLCLGAQLFTRRSEEGSLPGFGWLEADTIRFKFNQFQSNLKIPHMGWNYVNIKQRGPLWTDFEHEEEIRYYFVHSFHLVCHDEVNILATTVYGYEFPSVIKKDNIIGTQFHPEKSHKYGMKLLKNFVEHF